MKNKNKNTITFEHKISCICICLIEYTVKGFARHFYLCFTQWSSFLGNRDYKLGPGIAIYVLRHIPKLCLTIN